MKRVFALGLTGLLTLMLAAPASAVEGVPAPTPTDQAVATAPAAVEPVATPAPVAIPAPVVEPVVEPAPVVVPEPVVAVVPVPVVVPEPAPVAVPEPVVAVAPAPAVVPEAAALSPPKLVIETYTWQLPKGGAWPQSLVGSGSLEPPCDVTYQIDTYKGTREAIDAVVGDGVLKAGEDSKIYQSHKIVVGDKCPPVQPADKVEYGEWVDGVWVCDATTVEQTRTVTTTPYVWSEGKPVDQETTRPHHGGEWIPGTPVVTSESQTRDLTSEEIFPCPIVIDLPTVTPVPPTCDKDGSLTLPSSDLFAWVEGDAWTSNKGLVVSTSPVYFGPGTYTVTAVITVENTFFPDGSTEWTTEVTVLPKTGVTQSTDADEACYVAPEVVVPPEVPAVVVTPTVWNAPAFTPVVVKAPEVVDFKPAAEATPVLASTGFDALWFAMSAAGLVGMGVLALAGAAHLRKQQI